MQLLEKLDQLKNPTRLSEQVERILTHKISLDVAPLTVLNSTKELNRSDVYKSLKPAIDALTFGYECGSYTETEAKTTRPFYRAVLWHLESGVNFKGVLETLRNRSLVSQADVYFFPATDIGCARSDNRNVVRDLAIELGYHYYFATSYFTVKRDGVSIDKNGDTLGLEGNAIMSRWPLSNIGIIPTGGDGDVFKGNTKRFGAEKALTADMHTKDGVVTLVCLNMPSSLSPLGRARVMRHVTKKLKEGVGDKPVLIGGDLKTSNYNCRGEWAFVLSVLNKVYRGMDYIIEEHHTWPEKHFEKRLFQTARHRGFDFVAFNEIGRGCYHARLKDLLERQTSQRASKLTARILKSYGDKLVFKHDWFLANDKIAPSLTHQAERPKVISHLFCDGKAVSSHDPILLDFEVVKREEV